MTTPTLWVDAAYAANTTQVKAAIAAGAKGCGYYLPGQNRSTDDPLNEWTPQQVAAVRAAGFGNNMVGIWVPQPSLPGNPITEAEAAYHAAIQCGETPRMSGLYDGNHLTSTGQITGPVWLPIPGAQPTAVGSQSAIQWGQSSPGGWSVDWDIGASDFPWNNVIMVDFEYNTIGGQAGINWYHAFQKEITLLATPPAPPPLKPAAPVRPMVSGVPSPPVIFTTTDGNQHVFFVDGAGNLFHGDFNKAKWAWSPITLLGTGWAPNSPLTWYQYSGVYQVWGKTASGIPIQAYLNGTSWVVAPLT